MGAKTQHGFTVIETVLFLGVTGLLVLMIVGGSGMTINIQRYRDSVESFKSLVQQQYADLSNVHNERSNAWACSANATIGEVNGTGDIRGQSNCLLVGKYMRIQGANITTYPVLARKLAGNYTGDLNILRDGYSLRVATHEATETRLEWNARIGFSKAQGGLDYSTATSRNVGILFVRSPNSGQVYTFVSNSVPSLNDMPAYTFTSMITASARSERMICIQSDGMFVDGDKGIYITPYASGPNAIETRTNTQNTGGTKC